MNFKAVVAGVAVTVVAAAAALAGPAQAAPRAQAITRCGQNIRDGDAYLARNLRCSSGFRLLPGSGDPDPVGRNVSIDLRGHRLEGTGTGAAFDAYTLPGFSNLKVSNGRIENWGTGISVSGWASVSDIQLLNNGTAMSCDEGGCRASNSIIENNVVGVTAFDGGVELTKTALTGNGVGSKSFGALSSGTYTESTFTRNKIAVQYGGVLSSLSARNNVFTANGVGILGKDAVEDNDYQSSRITDNDFIENDDGIYVTVYGPEGSVYIAGNTALKNKRYGIYAPGATDGGGNKAAGNGQPCVGVVCAEP
jgi:hypothetical protein